MADGVSVVSLPAMASRMKNEAISEVEPLAVHLGGYQRGGQVVARVDPPILGHGGGVGADIDGDLHELFEVSGEIRVAEPGMMLVHWKIIW